MQRGTTTWLRTTARCRPGNFVNLFAYTLLPNLTSFPISAFYSVTSIDGETDFGTVPASMLGRPSSISL